MNFVQLYLPTGNYLHNAVKQTTDVQLSAQHKMICVKFYLYMFAYMFGKTFTKYEQWLSQ